MDTTVVACCQLAPVLGDLAGNRELTAAAVARAVAAGASVIVLPELASSGYVFSSRAEARSLAEPPDGETVSLWARLSAEHGVVIVGGFCEADGEDVRNSAALVADGTLRQVYRKAHLWDRERLWFTPGDQEPVVTPTRFGRISVMICYDLEFPEWARLPALDGAQLLCAPVNWPLAPRPEGERPAEFVRVQADAGVNRMFVAACDRAGTERGVDWVSGSLIADPDGWPLACAELGGGPVTIMAECALGEALDKRVGGLSDIHADRRPALYRRVAG
jgi:5-aminopentanamidase